MNACAFTRVCKHVLIVSAAFSPFGVVAVLPVTLAAFLACRALPPRPPLNRSRMPLGGMTAAPRAQRYREPAPSRCSASSGGGGACLILALPPSIAAGCAFVIPSSNAQSASEEEVCPGEPTFTVNAMHVHSRHRLAPRGILLTRLCSSPNLVMRDADVSQGLSTSESERRFHLCPRPMTTTVSSDRV